MVSFTFTIYSTSQIIKLTVPYLSWFSTWSLILNSHKFQVSHFGTVHVPYPETATLREDQFSLLHTQGKFFQKLNTL